MNTTRVLAKPAYSVTLLLLVIGTLIFIIIAIPTLMLLHEQDQLLDGIGLFVSALALITPLGFSIYEMKQAELDKSEKNLDEIGVKYIQNLILISLTNQESILRSEHKLELGQQLKATELDPEDIKAMIPPELSDRVDILLNGASQIAEHLDFRRSIAQHLEQNPEELKCLAVEAADEVLEKLSEARLKKLGIYEFDARGPFYGDIYIYLRGWLKSSIEYDMAMPEGRIHQSNVDRKLYIDTIKYIRDSKLDKFGFEDERQRNMVRRYLNILVDKLEN